MYANSLMGSTAKAKAQLGSMTMRGIFIQVINLILTLYLVGVRGMGAVGSALATFLTMTLLYPPLTYTLALRLADVRVGRWLRETIWPGWLPALASAFVCILLKITVRPTSLLSLSGCVACGLLCYLAVLLAFCLQPTDHKDLRKIMAKMLAYIGLDEKVPRTV